ncbi:MAG TPA: GH3 auxin-responsive promoter family protein [Tenuifilaceae bacterium]|nr:GH3 auxin-responsive promoter family protein [Tenuifilaceae bacterium]HPE19292.1 GH3 auxin-responsive promoter family protein [Tenuifilaceae bacterium]HPJ46760.1 GH3 auxin-responsive promoter family protein [Tenuifilaceae bacterium]HPQ33878.1 GH3 auxin-responsive promoter family protein [Tenuifilaceae bacterium]HRX68447.1 GH3 auxin-responsive promoter family protein [Tenuifilaceae bacterium]
MLIIKSLVRWLNTKRLHQIDLFRRFPLEVQEETLFKLLDRAKNTEYGKNFGFESFSSISDFQRNVPVINYEGVKSYVERLRNGETNLLWPGETKWFAKSSGTTSDKSKFIPVSNDALEECHFRGGKDVLAIYNNLFPENGIFSGKGLTLGGSHQIDNYSNESYYGDLSAILIENLPWWADFIRTPSQKVALIPEWEKKLAELTSETLKENVTNIAGVPSWNLVMIKHILDYTGKSNLLEVWPNLELFIHGGVNFTPYRDQFQRLIPSPNMHYMETYNASEGFFAIQDDPCRNDMLLMLDYGVFYEFIPTEQLGMSNPKVYSIADVEVNKNYAMLITTNSGLWRYMIGDTVMFTSTFPHKIVITGRTKHFINAFGEELIIDNAEKALAVACEKTGALIREYTAAPIYMDENAKGAHEWLIEFEKEPADLTFFTSLLDNALCSINSDYEAKRYKGITLGPPVVHSLKNDTFFHWMKSRGKLGGQNKVPRLSNNREYVDALLSMNAN